MTEDNIDILLVSETKLDGTFSVGQFCIDAYSTIHLLTASTGPCTMAEFFCIFEKIFPLK